MKPSIGRIVHVRLPVAFNGTHVHPAIITRVWRDTDPQPIEETRLPGAALSYDHDAAFINATVFRDTDKLTPAEPFGSIPLFATEQDGLNSGYQGAFAFWPPRV